MLDKMAYLLKLLVAIVLLGTAAYQLYEVLVTWYYALLFRLLMGPDSGPWYSFIRETLVFGFESLIAVGIASYLVCWKSQGISNKIAWAAFAIAVAATVALLVLVLLPVTTVR